MCWATSRSLDTALLKITLCSAQTWEHSFQLALTCLQAWPGIRQQAIFALKAKTATSCDLQQFEG